MPINIQRIHIKVYCLNKICDHIGVLRLTICGFFLLILLIIIFFFLMIVKILYVWPYNKLVTQLELLIATTISCTLLSRSCRVALISFHCWYVVNYSVFVCCFLGFNFPLLADNQLVMTFFDRVFLGDITSQMITYSHRLCFCLLTVLLTRFPRYLFGYFCELMCLPRLCHFCRIRVRRTETLLEPAK